MSVDYGAAVWCMDYDKERHQWQCLRSQSLSHIVARAPTVRVLVPSQLTMVDGGRHGYLVARGVLTVDGDVITITTQDGHDNAKCRQRIERLGNRAVDVIEAAAAGLSEPLP